jgi:broad specificity phosphatase PhoE
MADVGRFQFPGGESLPDLTARAVPAFEKVVARHPGGRIAVVAHGGSNRAILCHALGLGPERLLALGQDYAALSVLSLRDGRWVLELLNHCEPVLG